MNVHRSTVFTQHGMLGLWDYNHFPMISDNDSWLQTMFNEESLLRQIGGGYFVPIRVDRDGDFDVEVRPQGGISDEELRYLRAASGAYVYRASTCVCFGGIEYVEGAPPTKTGYLDLDAGDYVATIFWLNWHKAPGALTERGMRSNDSLPDYIVLLRKSEGRLEKQALTADTFTLRAD
jgi:hypothetical protein